MEKGKEKWADEVLDSITGIKKAQPNAGLFSKILDRIATSGTKDSSALPNTNR